MQSIKETAANVAASAVSGLEKTKAAVQEKVEKVTAHSPREKAAATEKKEERVQHAEQLKQAASENNAAAKLGAKNGGSRSFTATGSFTDRTTSVLPGNETPTSRNEPVAAAKLAANNGGSRSFNAAGPAANRTPALNEHAGDAPGSA